MYLTLFRKIHLHQGLQRSTVDQLDLFARQNLAASVKRSHREHVVAHLPSRTLRLEHGHSRSLQIESDCTLRRAGDRLRHTERAQDLGTVRGNRYSKANVA
jgi:hypothetical protein